MKTKSSHGLLVYFDDEGFCDFLELLILNGKLSLRFSIFCAEPATVVSDTAVNDSQWHAVTLRRNFKNTTLMVDNEIKWVEVKSKRRDMTVFSPLFVGGIPPELRSVALRLTSAAVKDQPPFTGWLTDIKVNNTESVMVDSEGVLHDLCGTANMCLNGGVCSLINNEATCDCSQTGFQGKDCSEGLAHLMMGDQGQRGEAWLLRSLLSIQAEWAAVDAEPESLVWLRSGFCISDINRGLECAPERSGGVAGEEEAAERLSFVISILNQHHTLSSLGCHRRQVFGGGFSEAGLSGASIISRRSAVTRKSNSALLD
ncbi:unnamed protein product [Pleuronectes platessa]|uniref:Uncharacterized protein n=1 Tax=Pleuronectes platessa TaxID=8262 RepID=A0A9N7Z0T6_PLEPL|nr:unnamed protein product [Pleuronectes platessa]